MTTYAPKTIEYEHATTCDNGECTNRLERIGNGYPVAWMLEHVHPGRAICDACCSGYCRDCADDASTDGKDATAFTNGWLLTLDVAPEWSLGEDLFTYADSLDEWLDVPMDYARRPDSVTAIWRDGSAVRFRRFTEGGEHHEPGDLTGEYLVLAPAECYALAVLAPPSLRTLWASDDEHATVVGAGGAVGWAAVSVCYGCERRATALFTDDELDDHLCAACYARDCNRRDN